MDFHPYEALDSNQGQNKVWESVKNAFKEDEGVAYYRYPIFHKSGRLMREPDIVLLHREYGLWVFECKGCHISNIKSIQGHEWLMNNWHSEYETPVSQAEDQMFAIFNRFNQSGETRNKVNCHFRVALPFINSNEWLNSSFSVLPTTEGVVLIQEQLTPKALRNYIEENSKKCKLSDDDWKLVTGVLGGTLPTKEPRSIPTGTEPENPIRVIHHMESQLKMLDATQQKIAFELPEGAQRLRGLAGTGKTVLLAKRIAKMHIKHPEWTIGYVFFTRSLYDQILELITLYHQEMHPDNIEPDWTKLKVLHAWGAREQQGFYKDLAQKSGVRSKTVNDVKNEIGSTSPSESFEYINLSLVKDLIIEQKELLAHLINAETIINISNEKINESKNLIQQFLINLTTSGNKIVPEIYDALIIDEGQDLPPIFYQLAYQSLKEPKRLYWAYDEAQGIGSLVVPEAEKIFGRKSDGSLVINLSGSYSGGIKKGHRMKTCYRTPRNLLMTAHALNMGLFREGGALQGFTNKEQWKAIGYEVVAGSFNAVGKPVTITRSDEFSPHPIDRPDFSLQSALGDNFTINSFVLEDEEIAWIVNRITNDIKLGFNPCDIIVTALGGDYEKDYFNKLKSALSQQGIKGYIAGVDGNRSIFQIAGHVTISNIFRAKGNEAWKVYASRFHYATLPSDWKQETELHKRNEAFVALTRSRVWCHVTGLDNPIFVELDKAIAQYNQDKCFTFPAFNQTTLKRLLEESEETLPLVP